MLNILGASFRRTQNRGNSIVVPEIRLSIRCFLEVLTLPFAGGGFTCKQLLDKPVLEEPVEHKEVMEPSQEEKSKEEMEPSHEGESKKEKVIDYYYSLSVNGKCVCDFSIKVPGMEGVRIVRFPYTSQEAQRWFEALAQKPSATIIHPWEMKSLAQVRA
jgi:hypothetical protein